MDSRPALPPISLSSIPTGSEIEGPPAPVRPPILASDVLREEVAPLAPAAGLMRRGLAAFAAGSLALCVVAFDGLLPRAPGALAGALVMAAMGAAGLGAEGAGQAVAGLVLVTLLPAALLFRAQYRAFPAARIFLGAALALAAPAVLFLGQSALEVGTPVALRIGDAAGILAVSTSFAGFLGAETTGACSLWGGGLLVLVPLRLFASASVLSATEAEVGGALAASAGVAVAGTVASIGLYQLLAAALATRARKVDVHRIVGPSAEAD
jgi:hypothetical protein